MARSSGEQGGSLKYLVTGGAGYIGSHITQTLLERGSAVWVLENFSTGKGGNVEARVRHLHGKRYAAAIPSCARRLHDVARADRIASEHPNAAGNVFNLWTGVTTPRRELLDVMDELIPNASEPKVARPRAGNMYRSVGSPQKGNGKDSCQIAGLTGRWLKRNHGMDPDTQIPVSVTCVMTSLVPLPTND